MMEKDFVLLVHFRDPFTHLGGSESVIRSHNVILSQHDLDVYILFPVYKEITIKGKKVSLHAWALLHGEKLISITDVRGMKTRINKLLKLQKCKGVFLHSLIFSDLNELYSILSFRERIVLYLHDYSTCCSQYTLMKNDMHYCGNARLYDDKCASCKYYTEGKRLKSRVGNFLLKIPDLQVVAPSKCLADNWAAAFPEYGNRIRIIGHKKCYGEFFENRSELKEKDKIRVAFIGKATKEKGFDFWINAVNRICARTDKYEFIYFGRNQINNPYIKNIYVSTVQDGLDAMIKALRKTHVHVAFLFSIIPETYSLTYYECMSSNCFIVTSELSGNIRNAVEDNDNGVVLGASCDAIVEWLLDYENVIDSVNEFRTNGVIGPESLFDNDDFLSLLKMEKDCVVKSVNTTIKNRLEAFFANLLYRTRYRQF